MQSKKNKDKMSAIKTLKKVIHEQDQQFKKSQKPLKDLVTKIEGMSKPLLNQSQKKDDKEDDSSSEESSKDSQDNQDDNDDKKDEKSADGETLKAQADSMTSDA